MVLSETETETKDVFPFVYMKSAIVQIYRIDVAY